MPRNNRVNIGEQIYHVMNRANGRLQIFYKDQDYKLFEEILLEMTEIYEMRILAYVIMPNHFHLLLYPRNDKDLSIFLQRLCNSHTRKVHAITKTNGNGHLYQGRYKSFLVAKDNYLSAVIKYIERNPVRSNLAKNCEDWKWGSAYRRILGTEKERELLDEKSFSLPNDYHKWINISEKDDDLNKIRISVKKDVPYGKELWVEKMIKEYHLESTSKSPGRPRKNELL